MKKRMLLLALALLLLFSACAAPVTPTGTSSTNPGTTTAAQPPQTYTYQALSDWAGGLIDSLNPHTIVQATGTQGDILPLVLPPLAEKVLKDSETGQMQWVFLAATDIQDVTKDHREDLTKYGATLTAPVEEIDAGYVFEIKLRPEMCWQDGTPITADDYLYSMEQLLRPEMVNSAIRFTYNDPYDTVPAGGKNYYNIGKTVYSPMEEGYDLQKGIAEGEVFINLQSKQYTLLPGETLSTLSGIYARESQDSWIEVQKKTDTYSGMSRITEENYPHLLVMIGTLAKNLLGLDWDGMDPAAQEQMVRELLFVKEDAVYPEVSFDTVGLYKVDDYTIRYVCQEMRDYETFLNYCGENWLVYKPLYEAGKHENGDWIATDYGTSAETSFSCGPYKVELLTEMQIVLVPNENYWEYTQNDDGTLSSVTPFVLDGANQPQYQATKLVFNKYDNTVVGEMLSKEAFLTGQLDEWDPASGDGNQYYDSSRRYGDLSSCVYSLIFNSNLEDLQAMDQNGNSNSVVLSNQNFRKAFSLAIDRSDLASLSSDWIPTPYEMPEDYSYRQTQEAKEAMCELYGLAYSEEAYASITGFDLDQAKALMKTACEELVQAGLYTAGEEIYIKVCKSTYANPSDAEEQMVQRLSGYLNAAAEGSGFGAITLELDPEGKYGRTAVPIGEYAISWTRTVPSDYDPYAFLAYITDALYKNGVIATSGCWSPHLEELTLEVEGQEVTMTWTQWTNSLLQDGCYADSDEHTKLQLYAQLEKLYMEKYYSIPMVHYRGYFLNMPMLTGYKVDYYSQEYISGFGFGDIRLLRFNYTDAEWEAFVAENGGTLDYTK